MDAPPPYIVLFLVIAIVAITIVLVLMMILILLNQKRQQFFKKKMVNLHVEYEKNMLHTRIEIQEQTLKNISQEIHDNISLSLTLAKLNIYTIQSRMNGSTILDHSLDLIGDAITDLSAISKSLNSDLITQQGLIKAIQQEVLRISRSTPLQIDLKVTGEPIFLSSARELFLFRIVQEAFNNVLKHAYAQTVSLLLHFAHGQVSVRIKDDGKGFDVETLAGFKGSSAGLSTMEDRVRLYNGQFQLQSTPQEGTLLLVTLPYA